jgi:glycerol-3-phosphate dehydrogenase
MCSSFAGLRPLAAPQDEGKSTKEISRHHKIMVSPSGLISLIGGKWTTYRKMAEDAVEYAIMVGELMERPCTTRDTRIHGYTDVKEETITPMIVYGSDREEVENLEFTEQPGISGKRDSISTVQEESTTIHHAKWLSEKLGIRKTQVIWAVREEMARSLEDVMARRTRALFLDARESMDIAPDAAGLMAAELGRGSEWIKRQVEQYRELARKYLVKV